MENRSKIDFGIVVWLVALSFWSGVSFMQIQANKELIHDDLISRRRMWDIINSMRDDVATIAGYIKAKEKYDN